MQALIIAATEARRASALSTQDVQIVITELGFVVQGWAIVNDHKATASQELDWREFNDNPDLLANSVRLVAMRLAAAK